VSPPPPPDGTGVVAVDMETLLADAPAGHKRELRLWLRLLACANLIEAELRRRLRLHFGTTLPRFDLLAQLERAGPDGLTLGEVSRRMMVSNGNVTGIAARLVAEGLVARRANPADRRAGTLRLTPRGRRDFARQSAAHEDWIAELLSGLAPAEQGALHRLLGRAKEGARAAVGGEAPQ
jgi:DNA-binding MarR family transcriptional regulator